MNENTNKFAKKAKSLYNTKNIKSAMHQIRLKKMYDNEIQKLESLKFNIESQILRLDSVEIMMVTVDTIKDTSEYYQNMHSNINITQLEDTLDEMVEHQDSATDIQSILSDLNTFKDSSFDEEELLNELKELSKCDDSITNKDDYTPNLGTSNIKPPPKSTIKLSDLPRAPMHTINESSISKSCANLEMSF